MSSAAVAIMASEPAGQPKKLHPLFASSKTDRDQLSENHNGGQPIDAAAAWPYPGLDGQMGPNLHIDGGSEFRPETERHWHMPNIAPYSPAMPGAPVWSPGTGYDPLVPTPGLAPYQSTNMFEAMPGSNSGAMSATLPEWTPGTMSEQIFTTLPGQMPTGPFGHMSAVMPTQVPMSQPEQMSWTMPGVVPIPTASHGRETAWVSENTAGAPPPPDQANNMATWQPSMAQNSYQANTISLPQPKRRGRPPKKQKNEAAADITSHFSRRSAGQNNAPNGGQGDGAASVSVGPETTFPQSSSTPPVCHGTTAPSVEAGAREDTANKRPKRILQFNPKTGTIGSPPKPKEKTSTAEEGRAATRPRPLVVPYGQGDPAARVRVGVLIDAILSSKCRVFPPSEPTKQATSKMNAKKSAPKEPATVPPKSTHPFFSSAFQKAASTNAAGSMAPAASNSTGGASSASYHTTTPHSPPRGQFRGFQGSSSLYTPQFGANNGILRVPGARFPAWPWKGVVHVRADENITAPRAQETYSLSTRAPKRKGNAIEVLCDESIMTGLVERLSVASVLEDIRKQSGDEFIVQRDLRLPQQHVESGRKLQTRLVPRLRTKQPGIASLFASLETRLSAFDNFGCEQLSWTQKYSPSCAAEVVQSGQEPYMLKDWLEALKVVSVDTGAGETGTLMSGNAKGGGRGALRKKRKKNKLDGFIVSSDEENDDMGEVSDAEADWSASSPYGLQKRTVVRGMDLFDKTGRVHARPVNAIVISGPHGCGKSAAVYAVAKELGFEVFEINASSRRNGRDVLDKIGDMTRNHLVQHRKHKPADKGDDPGTETDMEDIDGEGATEGSSEGRQATMSAFFKPKAQPAKRGRKPKTEIDAPPLVPAKAATPQDKKQSVILLEEADVLYEEDKQFWTTVMGLIAQSKRPFVITCNDETLIPLHLLQLHGIFRFSPPPVDEAVDRLLVVAACENHVLERSAVQALYEVRGYDFRAALMDLQFWCQMAVGDQRGGFDWFVKRWPTGSDLDEEGQVKRAISQDTYQEGMGWLRHEDTDARGRSAASCVNAEDDLLQQAWTGWQVDLSQWQDSSLDLDTWASGLLEKPQTNAAEDRGKRLAQLSLYEAFVEDMSDADLASCSVFASRNAVPMDATQPEMAPKTQDDYILGMSLLGQTTAAHGNDTLRLATATAMRCAAKRLLKAGIEEQTWDDERRTRSRPACLQEAEVVASIWAQKTVGQESVASEEAAIRRVDFSLAFDPIAVADNGFAGSGSGSTSSVEMSVFDRSLEPIAVDVAPFVRGIVAYEGRLQKQRQRLNTFLSETPVAGSPAAGSGADGDSSDELVAEVVRRRPKRMRTTRAALSALEGGSRRTTRKERWFQADINPLLVMRTGGEGWDAAVEAHAAEEAHRAATAAAAAAAAAAAVPSAVPTTTCATGTLSIGETAWQAGAVAGEAAWQPGSDNGN